MLDIKNKLLLNAKTIDEALKEVYSYESPDFQEIIDAQRYGVIDGGKRIRAFLTLEICRLFTGDCSLALPYACAIEMIHASSLIHDDMPCMDNDDMRRGKPSTHKKFGENVALLAGDAMMVKAFEIIAENDAIPAKVNLNAVRVLASCTGDNGMLAGQMIDIKAGKEKLDFETVVRLHKFKTGRLIAASAILGCIAAHIKESDARYQAVLKYAEKVGLAFQILDDILDYKEGKRELNSFLSFMILDDAQNYANELTLTGIEAIAPYDDGTLTELAKYLIKREY
jgi:geranylgeranyl pyrophosphate synthase